MADATPTSNLAPMFGDYVTDYLSKAQGLAGTGFQPYTGERYAGPSSLQQQAFSGIGSLSMPGYFGQSGNMYGNATSAYQPLLDASNMGTVQGFMNPYTQQVTDIGKREAQRSYDMGIAGRDAAAAKAGAFGGSRHGLVESEALRDLNIQKNDIQMKGDNAAYMAAMEALKSQRGDMLSQQRGIADTTLGAAGGLGTLGNNVTGAQQGILGQQLSAGATQQGIAQQPLDFGFDQWQQSVQYPYQQLQFQQKMLQGLPLSVESQPQSNALLDGFMSAGGIYKLLFGG